MKERIKSIDSLRGLAILAVVLIHTTTRTLEASGFNITGFSWTLFLNQISRFAVPLFFLISGLVLELSYKEGTSYWSFIKKRFSKIFIPYVFWSLFYYLLIYNQNHDNLTKVILTGNASYQLYFIPTLCIFYLIFPLLHKFYKFISNKFVLSLIFLSQIFFLSKDYFVKEFDLPDPIHIAILAYFIFVIGIISARNRNKIESFIKRFKIITPILTAFLGIYVFWEGRNRFLSTGNYLAYYSQWRPSILIYTLLIGLTFYYVFEHTKLRGTVMDRFSKHSFFVFFVHVAILEGVWSSVGKNMFTWASASVLGKILFDPVFFGIVALISFGISRLMHKISKVAKILG